MHFEHIATSPNRRAGATLDEPLDHLLACHRRIEERLDVLERAAARLEDHREEAPRVIDDCFRFFDSNGAWHTADEEDSLFPRLRRKVDQPVARFLDDLEAEHRRVERVGRGVRDLRGALPDPGARDFAAAAARLRSEVERLCRLYRLHIAAEDARLIGLGREALDGEELAAMSREMKARRAG